MTLGVIAFLFCLLVVQQVAFYMERKEWKEERKELVNRAIARHAGEVMAMDRKPKPPREDTPPIFTEGLS